MHWRNLIPGSLCAMLRVKVRRREKPITTDYSEIGASYCHPKRENDTHGWIEWGETGREQDG